MLATIAPFTAVEAATEKPSVSFNTLRREIDATVIAFIPPDETDPLFEPPLIAIPGPDRESDLWTVIWTLVPGPGIISAAFPEDKEGIAISPDVLPPNLRIKESFLVPGQPSQWQVTFQNNVVSANSFSYDIHAEVVRAKDAKRLSMTQDPTIVVTQDPIG